MYIHLGNNALIKTEEIIGIFDLDNTTVSARTRAFLGRAEKKGNIVLTGSELPKSFVVASKNRGDNRVYLAVLSPATLSRRAQNDNYFKEI
ncbi:MAG: DUF370 domain-containing protein [Clostridia bacterium]|nr:DUF370 domain-containing protein [Clostridia bacterium]